VSGQFSRQCRDNCPHSAWTILVPTWMIKPQIKGAGSGPKGPCRNLDKRDMNGTFMGQMRHWVFQKQKGQIRAKKSQSPPMSKGPQGPVDWLRFITFTQACSGIFLSWRLVTQCVPNWVLSKFPVNCANSVCAIVATVSRQSHLPEKIISRELWVQCTHNLTTTIWGMHAIYAQYAQYTGCEIPIMCFPSALSLAWLKGHTGRICRNPSGPAHLCLPG